MDDEWGPGPATLQLASLGAAAVPELEDEFTYPRFPIGPVTYEELFLAAQRVGPDAWPIALGGFHHWRDHGLQNASVLFDDLGERAELVAPFAALAFAGEAVARADPWYVPAKGGAPPNEREEWWRTTWDGLGAAGATALGELGSHPDPRVRAAAAALGRTFGR